MKPFRATYKPQKRNWHPSDEHGQGYYLYEDDLKNARTVLIVMILMESGEDSSPVGVFIDSDNSVKSAYLDRFTDCQSSEWRIE